MKIFITGGLGFTGSYFTRIFLADGHQVSFVERRLPEAYKTPEGVTAIEGDTTEEGPWIDELATCDVVINLAGASIFKRWNNQYKDVMYQSRVLTTRNVTEGIRRSNGKVKHLLSTSAVGYYGFHDDEIIDETYPAGTDYLARLSSAWEHEALSAGEYGARVVLCRFGIILGRNGGAMEMLKKVFRMRIGSRLGNGKQWFPWIHLEDLARAYLFILENEQITGPVNLTSPAPVRNVDMTRALNRAMGTFPLVPPAPGFALKLILGEFGSVLLEGQRAEPSILLKEGFTFRYHSIDAAFADILGEDE